MTDPWERRNGEGPKPFAALQAYIAQGPRRSIRSLAQEMGKSATLIAQWSSRWDWQVRVQAWDDEQHREAREAHRADRVRMEKLNLQLIRLAKNRVVERLQNIDIAQMGAGDVIRWLEVLVREERKAVGMTAPLGEVSDAETLARELLPRYAELAQAGDAKAAEFVARMGSPDLLGEAAIGALSVLGPLVVGDPAIRAAAVTLRERIAEKAAEVDSHQSPTVDGGEK